MILTVVSAGLVITLALAAFAWYQPGGEDFVMHIAFNRPGTFIASGSWTFSKLWTIPDGNPARTFAGDDKVRTIAFDGDGTRFAASSGSSVNVWTARTGELTAQLRGHEDDVVKLAWSPDSSVLATSGGNDGTARIWDPGSATKITRIDHRAPAER